MFKDNKKLLFFRYIWLDIYLFSVFCSVKWNIFSWLRASNIYQSETSLKKRCKCCIFGQFIEKEMRSKAVWGHRQLWQNILSLCREYQMVGSQLGILFIRHKNISSALFFLVSHCLKVFRQPVVKLLRCSQVFASLGMPHTRLSVTPVSFQLRHPYRMAGASSACFQNLYV